MSLDKLQPVSWFWLSVFVNKALLAYNHTHFFMYCLWLLSIQWQSGVVATEILLPKKYSPSGPFQKKFSGIHRFGGLDLLRPIQGPQATQSIKSVTTFLNLKCYFIFINLKPILKSVNKQVFESTWNNRGL